MKPVMSEQEFSSLLKLISTEVENAFVVFHGFEELNRLAISDKSILEVLNADALFWRGYRASVQTTMFMTLSRLFDTTSRVTNFQSLLSATIANPQLFDCASLGARKMVGGNKPEWWDKYMAKAWFPKSSADLKFLQKEFKPLAEAFVEMYLPLRHAIYAHRLMSDERASVELFPLTIRQVLRAIVNDLYDFVTVIEDLYLNGAEPKLRQFDVAEHSKQARSTVEKLLRKLVTAHGVA
jgi:hypothetical protein